MYLKRTVGLPPFEERTPVRNAVAKLLVLAVGLSAPAAPRLRAAAPPESWTPELMMQVKRIGSVQVSPDGKQVVYAVREAVMEGDRSEYRTQLYLHRPDGGGPLTQGAASCDDPQWSPDGRWVAFISGRSGKKNLWVIRPAGGEAQQLSDVKTSVGNYKWSPKGERWPSPPWTPPPPRRTRRRGEKDDARVVDENPR